MRRFSILKFAALDVKVYFRNTKTLRLMIKSRHLAPAAFAILLLAGITFSAGCNNKKKEAKDDKVMTDTSTMKPDTMMTPDTTHMGDTSGKGEQTPPPK
jgi:hypothetical protein